MKRTALAVQGVRRCLFSPVSFLLSPFYRLLSTVSFLPSPFSRLLSPVSLLLSYVSSLLSCVSFLPTPFSCLLSPVSFLRMRTVAELNLKFRKKPVSTVKPTWEEKDGEWQPEGYDGPCQRI